MDQRSIILLALLLPLGAVALAFIALCWVRYLDSPTSLRRLSKKLRRAKRLARQKNADRGDADDTESPEVQLSQRLSERLGGGPGASCNSLEELQEHDAVQLELAPDIDQEELDPAVLEECRAASAPRGPSPR